MTSVPVGQILTELAREAPERPAITCSGRTVTRAELESRANRLARTYDQLGVREGSFVTVALPNGIEFYEACYAIWKLGAVPQPVSHRLPTRERQQIIDLADPPLIVGLDDASEHGRPVVPAEFVPDPSISDSPLPRRSAPSWKAQTSGGSTGRPKLIVSGHAGDLDPAMGSGFGMRPGQVQLVAGPVHHSTPFTFSMLGSYLGHHLVVLPKFDAAAALDAIGQFGIQFVGLVPTMMLRMLRLLDADPASFPLGSLETVWHTGAPCPEWLKDRWIELVGGDRLLELYGGTESQAVTAISGTEWLAHRGSVGRPVVGEMRVVDANGNDAARGTVGEIYLRPPAEMGRYRYVGATARTLPGGWESLGDMGSMDEGGYVYLADRRTDMLLVGGANVYPAEVEAAILEHPQVLSCVVVGLPDADLGERVHAVVQRQGTLDEAELHAFVKDQLAPYKIPRSIRFTDDPVRDDAGKVRRSAVKAREITALAVS